MMVMASPREWILDTLEKSFSREQFVILCDVSSSSCAGLIVMLPTHIVIEYLFFQPISRHMLDFFCSKQKRCWMQIGRIRALFSSEQNKFTSKYSKKKNPKERTQREKKSIFKIPIKRYPQPKFNLDFFLSVVAHLAFSKDNNSILLFFFSFPFPLWT